MKATSKLQSEEIAKDFFLHALKSDDVGGWSAKCPSVFDRPRA